MQQAGLARRFWVYLNERFPLYQFVPLSVVISLSSSAVSQYLLWGKVRSFWMFVLAFAALFLFLFRLRLFDEPHFWPLTILGHSIVCNALLHRNENL